MSNDKHAMADQINHHDLMCSTYTIGIPGDLHGSTTALVLDTAHLMGRKLLKAQEKYGFSNGWQDTDWQNPKDGAVFNGEQVCRTNAFEHVLKGDPIDVANYAAFQAHHGWSSAPQSREEAQAWVAMLQERFDLIDDNAILRELIEKMEERHGETFNAFYEAIVKRFLLASGIERVEIDTNNLFAEVLSFQSELVIEDKPGKLVYRLKKDDVDA